MFSYYGAKTRVVDYYPPPRHDLVIEPFAGSARYALKYWDRDVIILDKYELVVNVWKWLQKCSYNDIMSLPRLKYGDHVDKFKWDCPEQRDFIGFLTGFANTSPRRTGTLKLQQRPNWLNHTLKRVANRLDHIRHWDVRHGSYTNIYNRNATWFIDPPYVLAGEHYVHGSNKINYKKLGEWCRDRKGFVIVCESKGAQWLPFTEFRKHRTARGSLTEVVWFNQPTNFDNEQLKLKL